MISSRNSAATITVERWRKAQELFHSALELTPPEWDDYLDEQCGSEPELRDYVRMLLTRYESAGSFLETPAGQLVQPGDRALAEGRVLAGRFRIVKELGRGGMGEVYEAYDEALSESMALKRLSPELARDAETLAQFKQEIQLARKVTHPNICRIFDFEIDFEDGTPVPFLTMELLPGETLASRIAGRGPLAPAEALSVLREVVAGLEAAHQAGIVHRDLKPANLMLVEGTGLPRRTVIMDFGLALSQREAAAAGKQKLAGTPMYMAPEQFEGREITGATDVFALGLVIHEMLTGEVPSGGPSLTRLLDAAAGTGDKRETASRAINVRRLPPRWARVVLRCLDPAPAKRWSSPGEVLQALDPPRWKRRSAVAALLASGVAGVAWWFWPRTPKGAATQNVDADAAFQKGRLHARRLLPDDLRKAINYFNEAIRLDPEFAAAYSGLADAYSTLVDYGGMPHRDAYTRAQQAAARATRLGPELGQAHASLGLALSLDPRNWLQADAAFRRAIELDPRYGPAHQWYGAHLARVGKTKEAIQETRLALQADPVSLPISAVLGWMYYYDRQFQVAVEQGLRTVDLDPNFLYGYLLLARAYLPLGEAGKAMEACRSALDISRRTRPDGKAAPVVESAMGCVHAARGEVEAALGYAAGLEERRRTEYIPIQYLASVYAMAGRADDAFRCLRQGFEEADPGVLYLKVYPPFDELRRDERYGDLLRRLGL